MEETTHRNIPFVDSHLDLAEGVTLFGRDLTLTATETRAIEQRTAKQAMVSLPDMERGGIAVAFASIVAGFMSADAHPASEPGSPVGRTAEQAEAEALTQIELYESWESQGRVRLIKSVADLDHHLELWQRDRKPGLVMQMEGAEPIVEVSDLPRWWKRGLRMIALAWSDTRYAAGVGVGTPEHRPGGLTPNGVALMESMAELGFIWDIAHLAEDAVWEGLDMRFPRVCSTHANARAITPTTRHLTDDTIRALAERDGVMGLVLFNRFLDSRWADDKSIPVTLERVRLHAEHVAGIAGWDHVGIGSDLDGGFGLEETPIEIDTVADFHRIGDVIPAENREAVLSGNWLRFLRRFLPR